MADILSTPVWKQLLTGPDNEGHELANWMAVLGCLVFIGLAIYSCIKGEPFHPAEYGGGLGMVIGAFGAAQKLRGDAGK